MTPTEAVKLTAYIQAHFPSQPINEFTPDALWELLGDYPAEDCRKAVLTLASGRVQWCAPSDVCAEVKRMRSKRLAQAGDLCPPPGLTQAEEREWLGQARRRIANGEEVVANHGELKPRNLRELRALVRRVDPVAEAESDPDRAAGRARALDDAFDEMTVNSADTEFVVVHGACPTGADRHASEWVQAMNDGDFGWIVSEERHPADWSQGRGAGPERNLRMVQTGVDLCLAFIGPCTSPRCGRVDRNHPSHGASGCANLAAATGVLTKRWTATRTDQLAGEPENESEEMSA